MTEEPKCDFCSQRPVCWSYPAGRVQVTALLARPKGGLAAVGMNSTTPWAACDPCHDLIERGDRTGLRERSVSMFPHATVLTKAQLRHTIKRAHDGFFEARSGDPTPYEEAPTHG
ncbi:MAG: hypothetical protein QOF36_2623 [Microbacteriaceae bacterium]|jgi:hypothetical protein|nr:hypothetical protein [Microbacteriaceae bacterium]